MADDRESLDVAATELAGRLAELGDTEATSFRGCVAVRLVDSTMAGRPFESQLVRFVDTFQAMADDDVLRRAADYFQGTEAPRALDPGIGVAEHVPFGDTLTAAAARRNTVRRGVVPQQQGSGS